MSTPINDGGPAFPRPSGPPQEGIDTTAKSGMSLRDWFAGQALPVVMQAADTRKHTIADVGIAAYSFADAMLAAREVRS